jgi:hypothetical protein
MVYEARQSRGFHLGLAVACALLSILGFAVAGVIPTESGSYPAAGWGIVAACFAAAFVFVRRGLDGEPQARIDERGVWTRRTGPDPVPWSEIDRVTPMRVGIQRLATFGRRGGRSFGINATFYDRGIDDLVAAVRHYRPDLVP